MIYLIALIIVLVAAVIQIFWLGINIEDPVERAGRRGEEIATDIISRVLTDDDILLTNVRISFEGSRSEVDNLIINSHGVFIIEAKNYVGELVGGLDDYEWKKYKITPGGDIYCKTVKNPIKQVKRQIYILSHILKQHKLDVWVDGYVILLEKNSPVDDNMILESLSDIDKAIHGLGGNRLSDREIDIITGIFD
ncbi:MAG: NERD domain-containing protein [Pseudobutyrivibrio sp.]|uniref:nuclease-related domain-containing protein n=1 Tax=Pseudobutyrivibrio sp. TaxID=2014367 RepID=UPI0025F6DA21|nr:nuclease-related domain-containing protein [Pseudobutyrivibrio sp.]MBQ6463856.1 NERD domain-containing protein [Pseudobutyrivibrio sp.]